MSINRFPEHWNDLGMDWSNPDPLNITYHYALQAAIEERIRAKTNYPYIYNRIYEMPVQQNMVINASLFRNYMKNVCELLYYAIKPEFFFEKKGTYEDYSSYGRKAFFSDVEAMVLAFISQDMTIEQMKRVMIQLKTMLDNMYLFTPNIAFDTLHDGDNSFSMHEYGSGNYYPDDYDFPPNATNLYKANAIKEELFKRYNKRVEEDVVKKEGSSWYCRYNCYSFSWGGYAHTGTSFPQHVNALSPYVRSFCKPKLMGILFVDENSYTFFDYETGLLPGEKRLLDYGKIKTNEKMECPINYNQYALLDDPDFYSNNEEGVDWSFGAVFSMIYAYNYNVEGGFKFRPDSEN